MQKLKELKTKYLILVIQSQKLIMIRELLKMKIKYLILLKKPDYDRKL